MSRGTLFAAASAFALAVSLSASGAGIGIDGWAGNADGGAISIAPAPNEGPNGSTALRLTFENDEHQWGNAVKTIELPPNACGVEFDIKVLHALPASAMHLWLMEKDGDGWVARVSFDGKPMTEFSKWSRVFVPLTSFSYEARGNKTKELLTADRLMLGLNYGESEILVANLSFRTIATSSAKPARTSGLQIRRGARGSVAILHDSFKPLPGDSNPSALSSVLTKAGYGVTLLKAGDMSDPAILTRANFDCLVLPYGARYPAASVEAVKAYLKSGGSFVSMGGYAFDQACAPGEGGRMTPLASAITARDIAQGTAASYCLNTRNGIYGDTLQLQPDQIGVFDPCYHLSWVSESMGTGAQSAVPGSYRVKGAPQGYAACSLLGSNSPVFPDKWGRHIPIVRGFDSLGRYRGDIGAIAFNYAGPYAGSGWAFFGVTDRDLFSTDGGMLAHLPAIVDSVVRKTFLHSLKTDLAMYRDGETVKLSCKAADLGPRSAKAGVRFTITDRAGKRVFTTDASKTLKPGETATFEATYAPQSFPSDLYRVVAELTVDGKAIDSMETGFAAYSPKTTAGGFDLKLKGNYFHDGDRTVLLSGTNETGAVFYSGNENPLVWDSDLARMNENGLNVLRVLHFSPFLSAKPSVNSVQPLDLNVDRMPLATERQLDALMQLCQKHKIVLFLSIHDWMRQDLSDEELAAQRRFAKLIAERYKNTPGFIIDIQNEPSIDYRQQARGDELAHVVTHWNEFLKARYGDDASLRAAWKLSPPEGAIGSIPYRMGSDEWSDARTRDAEEFRNLMGRQWVEANLAGAKEANPGGLVSCGFLQEYWSLNKILAIDGLDFANFHSYATMDSVRPDIKLFDRRFEGKSVSIGEFGSRTDHDRRGYGQDTVELDYNWYLLIGHYLFGMGGSFIENWDWKEMDDCVFPWGINYQCGGPAKTILEAYRNQSLLFRSVQPVYKPQEVFLVIPTDQTLGGRKDPLIRALFSVSDAMSAAHVDYGTIDDRSLDKLPASAKLLIYPFPFSVPDDAYAKLKEFVGRGGRLLVTGDVSYDRNRERTKLDRLQELCGVRFVKELSPDVSAMASGAACIEVEPVDASLQGPVYVRALGGGQVLYTPSLRPDVSTLAAALSSVDAVVDSTAPYAFRLPLSDGGRVYVMVNTETAPVKASVRGAGEPRTELVLGANSVGLVRYGADGRLLAIESHGPVSVGGRKLFEMTGHFAVVSCDGADLAVSREMLILPFGGGELRPTRAGMNDLTTQTGEVVDGEWRRLSESGSSTISAANETAFDIRIVAPKDRLTRLGRFVASELMLKR